MEKNGKVSSVYWKFSRIDKENEQQISQILELGRKVFGEWFLSKNELIAQVKLCEKDSIKNALVMVQDEMIVWFWICYLWGKWDTSDVEIDERFDNLDKIGYIKTIVIDPGLQWKNYWSVLLKVLLENAKEAGNENILLHAWNESPDDSSRRFFKKHWALSIKNYNLKWYEDSKKNGWMCSRCGNPCTCSSTEMILNLSNLN